MSVHSKMTALANEVRELSGATEALSIDAMTTNVGDANDEVNTQVDLIAQLSAALEGKASATSSLQSKTVTPTTATQIVTADDNYDGLRTITVNGDENLIAENIKSGISIFGVEGTHSGGVETSTVQLRVINATFTYVGINGLQTISNVLSTTVQMVKPSICYAMPNLGFIIKQSATGGCSIIHNDARKVIIFVEGESGSIDIEANSSGGGVD